MKKEHIGSIALSLAQLAAGLVLSAILSRALGIEEFGVYAIAVSAILIASVLVQLGLTDILLKQTAIISNDEEGSQRGTWRLWNSVDRIAIWPSALGALGFLVWFGVSGHGWLVALLAAAQIPLLSFLALRSSALRGLGRSNTAHLLISVFPYAFGAVAVYAADTLWGIDELSEVLWILLLGLFISLLTLQFLREREGTGGRQNLMGRGGRWVLLKQSLPMMGVASISIFNSQVDVLLLGLISGASAAGLYQAALQITMALNLIKVKLAIVVSHKVAALARQKKMQEIVDVMQPITIMTTAMAVALFCVILVWGEGILVWMFGPDFATATGAALIIGGSLIIGTAAGPVGSLMIMSGNQKDALHSSIGAALVNIVLNPVFILALGPLGSALTLMVSVAWWNGSMVYKAKKKLNIDVTIFSALRRKQQAG